MTTPSAIQETHDRSGEARRSVRPVAVIDVGTTSIRMAIAEICDDGSHKTLETLSQSVALGKDTFTRGRLSKSTIEAAVRVLKNYRRLLREYGIDHPDQIRVVATSAVREAENRLAFLDRVYSATGLDIQSLDEAEASRVTYLSVQPLLKVDPALNAAQTVVMEMGGGSTEVLVVKTGDVLYSHTYRLGALRLRQMLDQYPASRSRARSILEKQISLVVEEIVQHVTIDSEAPTELVALGGDVRFALARLRPNRTQDPLARLSLSDLESLTDGLLEKSVDELMHKDNLSATEAETLGPALLGVVLTGRRLGVEHLSVSSTNLRDGLLEELASREAWRDDFREQVIRSAVDLGRKMHFDEKHALHVARLSRILFAQLQPEHQLDSRYELILSLAAVLHEIGLFVTNRGYHKHSLYLISHSELFGMSKQDLMLVGLVTRYHRRSSPKPSHEVYMSQSREHRIAISKMAAILRVATALERSRSQRIDDVKCAREHGRLVISVPDVDDLSLEQLALKQTGSLFEEIFGRATMLRTERRDNRR